MATIPKTHPTRRSGDRRFLLQGIRWETYEALLKDQDTHRVRMTYDRGSLEFMSPGTPHESDKRRIGRMIEAMTEELNIPIRSGGSTTLRKQLLKRGLEPDECYWIQTEGAVRGLRKFDLVEHPPDLAIEVESSRSALDRVAIYAALGVPELWRWDGTALHVAVRQADGNYAEQSQSAAFPFLPLEALVRFLGQAEEVDETTWIRSFRAWVRAEIAPLLGDRGRRD
jgi:Uma2 family endonuclease